MKLISYFALFSVLWFSDGTVIPRIIGEQGRKSTHGWVFQFPAIWDQRRKIPNSNEFEWCMLIPDYHPESEGAQLARFNRGSFCHEYETEKLIARKRTSKLCVSRELLDDLVQINHLSNDHNRLKPFGARRDHAETFYMFMSKFPSFLIPPAFKVVIYRPNKIHEKITQFWLVKINAVFT